MKKIILSDYKLNLLVDDVTEKLLTARPLNADTITGASIVDYCPHKQVGQFLLFRIYQDATQYVAQLNHPHFDFGSQEVKEDLRRFLSTLSRNIRLPKRDFETLLRQAVYNNVKLILNPEDSITNFFFGNSDAIPIELYRKHAPYFTDYDFVIRAIMAWYEKQQLNRVERDVFIEKLQRVVELYEKKEGKSFGEYQRALFKSLTQSDLDTVMAATQPPVIRTESASTFIETKPEVKAEPKFEPKQEVKEENVYVHRDNPMHPEAKEEQVKKPLITIKPKEHQSQQVDLPVVKVDTPQPPLEEPKSIPAWIEQKTPPPPPKEEPTKQVFAPNTAPPRSETPPWVEKAPESKPEAVILDPLVPLEEEKPVVKEEPAAQLPTEQPEKRTLGSTFEHKEKGSLNERFTQREERPNILERAQQGNEKPVVEERPASILDRFSQPKQEQPAAEPVAQEPVLPQEPAFEMPVRKPEPPVEEPPVVQQQPRTVGSLEPEAKTLADRFKDQSSSGSVGDTIGSKNIRTEQIPVHKQFQYVQKVFGGSSVKFKVILDKINKTQNLAEAEEVLEKYVFNDPTVNRNDKVAKEFEQLVRDRFE